MPLYVQIIVDLAVFWFFFGNYVQKYCRTPQGKRKYQLAQIEKFFHNYLLRDRDILEPRYVQRLTDILDDIRNARKSNDDQLISKTLEKYSNDIPGLPPAKKGAKISDQLEVLVVALGLAFGVRSLFIQPFKIPTGSMQPTLYGIHFTPAEELPSTKIGKFFSFLNFSRQNIDVVAKSDGRFDWDSMQPGKNYLPFFPSTQFLIGMDVYRVPGSVAEVQRSIYEYYQEKARKGPLSFRQSDPLIIYNQGAYPIFVRQSGDLDWSTMKLSPSSTAERPITTLKIGSETYDLPGLPEDIKRNIIRLYLNPSTSRFFDLKAGDTLIRGFLETGDHLFVNRLSLAFKEPKRGDVMVFTTDDLEDPDGSGFGGRYYVKRLVGLPGDTLKIVDRKLYVKPAGENDFRLLDANDAKGFERIYSETGAYHGYAHMPEPAIHLTSNSAEMQIPEGHYVMLGDNSENSKDSRYWGSVPRKNLVGKPGVVWWPLSRRWGFIDRLDPDPAIGPTPANYPVIP